LTRAEITIEPESRYRSLINLRMKMHSLNTQKIELTIPTKYKIIEIDTESNHTVSSEDKFTKIQLHELQQDSQIQIELKISDALNDSGYSYYPYVTSYLTFEMELTGINEISLLTVLPPTSGPYSMLSSYWINDRKFVWQTIAKENDIPIAYYSKGEGKKIQPVLGADYKTKEDHIIIKAEIPFRIKTVKLPSFVILPLLIGFPLMIIWGLESIPLLTKLTSSLASVPLIFAVWQRNTADSLDPTDFLNTTWLLSIIGWILYALYFQLTGRWISTDILSPSVFIPYFGWIIYHMAVLAWFRNNPTKLEKIPKWFYPFAITRSFGVYVQDRLTHKGKLYEPEAQLFRKQLKIKKK